MGYEMSTHKKRERKKFNIDFHSFTEWEARLKGSKVHLDLLMLITFAFNDCLFINNIVFYFFIRSRHRDKNQNLLENIFQVDYFGG